MTTPYVLQSIRSQICDASGAITMRDVRVWSANVSSTSSGAWTVDYSIAGFEHLILNINVTAQYASGSTLTLVPFASISSYGLTAATGYVLNPTSQTILLGGNMVSARLSNAVTQVFVYVMGY